MTNTTISVALVGIGGYGERYVDEILTHGRERDVIIVAAIDPAPERCSRLAKLKAMGVGVYSTLSDFFAEGTADLVVISAPIHLHCDLTCLALKHGANVLCEKPLAATVQEARQMAAAQAETDKFVGIGYQWSFSTAIQALKRDIMADTFGQPIRLKTLVCWPRTSAYYARSGWAGKIRSAEGNWILDSPANNATAHFLHNMFYVLGDTQSASASPASVTAELYRGNPVENFDTAAIRCFTKSGVEIMFYTTHAVHCQIGPMFCYEFEHAKVYYDYFASRAVVARFDDGRTQSYGDPQSEHGNKLWQCAEAIRTGCPVACDINSAMPQTICINAAQESMPQIVNFAPDRIVQSPAQDGSTQTCAAGLLETFVLCYDLGVLPAEHGGIDWAQTGQTINTTNYINFPQTIPGNSIK